MNAPAAAPAAQTSLFDDASPAREAAVPVRPMPPDPALQALADALGQAYAGRWHLGTSSWHFPGWAGQVWARTAPEAVLSRQGLRAYAQHPLLRTVSLDRAFYRPLDTGTYAALAAQVPADFRFVVKAVAQVTDATLRDPRNGKAISANPSFLDVPTALAACVTPAAQGLGARLGVLVFQLSPLPAEWLHDTPRLHARLDALFEAVVPALPAGSLAALEVRDPALLTPALARLLRHRGVRYTLGLHDRLPAIDDQLDMLRAMWPGDLVCRWNLQRGQRYAQARDRWAPFDRLQAPDLPTRTTLARVVHATLQAGHRAFVTINNKAEGSAPASVRALAEAVQAMGQEVAPGGSPAAQRA